MYGILVHHRFLADYQIVALAYTGGLMVSMFEPRSSCMGSNILGKMLISLSVQGDGKGSLCNGLASHQGMLLKLEMSPGLMVHLVHKQISASPLSFPVTIYSTPSPRAGLLESQLTVILF